MNERELIYTSVLNCSRTELYFKKLQLKKEEESCISEILEQRKNSLPLQYILGKTEFMGLEFKVRTGVFIPRPETEILVETAIKFIRNQKPETRNQNILDIGTGSGNIAVSLAKFLPNTDITAIDISKEAIGTAKQNTRLNNVKINFLLSDLFSNSELRPACRQAGTMNYELIISNPPYIPTGEIDNLQPEIKYEPRIALDGGKDGLDFYRRIIKESPHYLKADGFLIMEVGFGQCSAIKEIFQKSERFKITDVANDYSGIDRVIVAQIRG